MEYILNGTTELSKELVKCRYSASIPKEPDSETGSED